MRGVIKKPPRRVCALIETSPARVKVESRRVEYDVENVAQAILDSELPDEIAGQLRTAMFQSQVEPATSSCGRGS